MNATTMVLVALGAFGVFFSVVFFKDFFTHKDELEENRSWGKVLGIGLVVNFFDTLGIGSFAPTTASLRGFKQCEDRYIPGVLNVGCCIPVILEAFLFIDKVEVEPVTLVALLAAAVVGSYVGSKIVSKLPTKKIQFVMGVALLITATIFFLQQIGLWVTTTDSVATGLSGSKLIIGIVIYFILGALMPAGVGLYGPGMAVVYLLGLSPLVAFPLVMGSCAFLMPVASAKFIKEKAYERKASMGITIGGIVGVLIAVYIVGSMPLNILIWLVIVVVTYTAITLLMAATKKEVKEEA